MALGWELSHKTIKDLIGDADNKIKYHLYPIRKDFVTYAENKVFFEDKRFAEKKGEIKDILMEIFNLDYCPENLSVYLVSRKMSKEQEKSINEDFTVPIYKVRIPLFDDKYIDTERVGCYIPGANCFVIWLDILLENSENIDFKTSMTFVMIHELTHAMMNVDGESRDSDPYRLYSEESLANGNALCYMQQKGCECMNKLQEQVLHQPEPYQLGLYYQDPELLKKAMSNWINAKKDKSPKDQEKELWFKKYASIGYPSNTMQREITSIEQRIYSINN